MFKPQSPLKYSPFDALHLLRHVSHCSEQFSNSSVLLPFSASASFCFISSTSAKHYPLRTFSIRENKKKVTQDKMRRIGRVGHQGHTIFGQKLLHTQHSVGRYTHKSSIMKWANESSKICIEAARSLSQQRQLVHCYRWVPRTLT